MGPDAYNFFDNFTHYKGILQGYNEASKNFVPCEKHGPVFLVKCNGYRVTATLI